MATLETARPPGAEMASRKMDEAIAARIAGRPTGFPNKAAFVGADTPGLGKILARCAREHTPVVLVYPDGETRVLVERRPGLRERLSEFFAR